MSFTLAAMYSRYLLECGVRDRVISLGSCPGAIRYATPSQTRIVIDHHLMEAIYDKCSEILRSLQQYRTTSDQPDRSGQSIVSDLFGRSGRRLSHRSPHISSSTYAGMPETDLN